MTGNKTKDPTIKKCIFCGRSDDNEILYGKFHHRPLCSVHQNCLFFSSGLEQRAKKSSNGISRFLIKDIKDEANRGKRLRCCYCRKIGATIGCVLKNCSKTFHFPCGVEYRSLHQHFDNFPSYCDKHKPLQKNVLIKEDLYCYICCNSISKDELPDCLYSPCCRNNWFHRMCLQQYAISAGSHFFKCPLCNNTSKFVKEMLDFGISVPQKDAEWELEENAFGDLLFRPECDPSICKCSKGRKHDGVGDWQLLSCYLCGSSATHRLCRGLHKVKTWICTDCETIQADIEKNKKEASLQTENTESQDNVISSSSANDFSSNLESSSVILPSDSELLKILQRQPIVKLKRLEMIAVH